jgi:hypothetical protein
VSGLANTCSRIRADWRTLEVAKGWTAAKADGALFSGDLNLTPFFCWRQAADVSRLERSAAVAARDTIYYDKVVKNSAATPRRKASRLSWCQG